MTETTKKRRTRWTLRVVRTAVLLLVIYVLWLLVACSLQERILFPGATIYNAITRSTPAPGVEWEKWDLPRDEGAPGFAWFHAAPGAPAPAPAVVFFHGNGDTARDRTDIGARYARLGVHALLVEYPGYDDSPGTPRRDSIVADALIAIDMLAQRDDVDADRIIYHGHSIGGGVAAQVASERPPRALVLVSTFTSLRAMVNRYAVPSFLLRHRFPTDGVLETLDAPTLIIHGDRDLIVYPSHALVLDALAKDSTLVRFPARGHNDIMLDPGYDVVIRDFLARHDIIDDPEDE